MSDQPQRIENKMSNNEYTPQAIEAAAAFRYESERGPWSTCPEDEKGDWVAEIHDIIAVLKAA